MSKTKATKPALIDDNAGCCLNCGGTRAQYTYDRTHRQALRICLKCNKYSGVEDASYECGKVLTTVEAWRDWWLKVYDTSGAMARCCA
jgi:hypothetical protein